MFISSRRLFVFVLLVTILIFYLILRQPSSSSGYDIYKGMGISPEDYRKVNYWQNVDGQAMLERIPRSFADRVKTVVEIGCGSGDMTKVLTEAIPNYSRFLSLDIDPVMVQHASQVNSGKGVEFVVQDFNVPFDNMDSKLQQLENEVDLIWSNYVLHFMKPKNRVQALQAVRRLLKDNGMVYVNIPLTGNLLNYWSPERRVALGMLLKIPHNDDQEVSWKREFVQAGLHINFTKIRHRETTLIRSKLKPYTNLISSAASVHLTEEEKTEETLTLLKDLSDVSTQDLDDKVYMHEVILSLVATK